MLSMKENSSIHKHKFLDKKVLECSNSKFNISYCHIQELHNDVLVLLVQKASQLICHSNKIIDR